MEALAQEGTADNSRVASALEEVVVTSTRQAESLSKVPISVAVLTEEQMQSQGVKEFRDIARLTPGLTFNSGYAGTNDIAIRGVSSRAGASTTGVYIDDVPIQARQVGFSAGTLFPEVFDLERVEVLRGPQGTLFGAGSEGGTVRFIQPSPSLVEYTGTARLEGSGTRDSEESYEAGVAFGGPIVADVLGFRASAFQRHTGGWIDLVPETFNVIDETGAAYGGSATTTQTGPARKNVNSADTTAARLAFTAAVTDSFLVTPSFFYQKQRLADPIREFTLVGSDPRSGRFTYPLLTAGPVTDGGFTQLHSPSNEDGSELRLSSVSAQWDVGAVSLYSTTAYVDQSKQQVLDATLYYVNPPQPGEQVLNLASDSQHVFTQEVRLQSNASDARVKWVAGAYYSRISQNSFNYNENNMFANASSFAFYGAPAVAGGDPFGPGYSAFQNTFGVDPIDDSGTFSSRYHTLEEQLAGFAQADIAFGDFTLTAGVRVSRNELDFNLSSAGAENNLNAPFGAPCPTGGFCPFGSGAYEPLFSTGNVKNKETAVTPKIGLSYQALEDLLVYVSASKGFRPGGGQLPLPTFCGSDLVSYGYVDGQGNPDGPLSFDSDTVWSYEVGQKLRAFDGRLTFDSSAYMIEWDKIQQVVSMPTCGFNLTDNLGSATIKGFDLLVGVLPFAGLSLNASVAYTHTSLDDGVYRPDGVATIPKSSAIEGAGSPWTAAVSALYEVTLTESYEGYVRADYTYGSEYERTGRANPGAFNFDPLLLPQEATSLVNMRLGIRRDQLDASVFVNNLLDEQPILNLAHAGVPGYFWTASTFRPRTIGVTVTYHYGR